MMKKQAQFRLTPIKLVSIILVSSLMAWLVYSVSAATGTISLSTKNSKVSKGETFTITLREVTDVPLITVVVKIKFDPQKVKYKNIDFTGTPFTNDMIKPIIGSDYIQITRFFFGEPHPSGDNFIANIDFEAVASSGTAVFTIEKGNGEDTTFLGRADEGDDINYNTKDVQVNITSSPVVNPPVSPPSPPTANPAGPTHTVTPPPSTPTTPPAPSTSRPTTPTTPAPSTPPSSNPISNYFRPATNPTSTQFNAGDSKLSKQPSLMQKALIWVKLLAPIVVVGTIIIGVVWFVIKKASMHAFGFGEAVTGLPHVGPVKTPIDNTPANVATNQPVGPIKPSPSSGTVAKPSSYTDPNDHTPRTFSGV